MAIPNPRPLLHLLWKLKDKADRYTNRYKKLRISRSDIPWDDSLEAAKAIVDHPNYSRLLRKIDSLMRAYKARSSSYDVSYEEVKQELDSATDYLRSARENLERL